MSACPTNESATLIRFAPASKQQPPDDTSALVDKSGRAIVALLQEAADLTQENTARALGMAHRLSVELRTAEDRIKQLDAETQRRIGD